MARGITRQLPISIPRQAKTGTARPLNSWSVVIRELSVTIPRSQNTGTGQANQVNQVNQADQTAEETRLRLKAEARKAKADIYARLGGVPDTETEASDMEGSATAEVVTSEGSVFEVETSVESESQSRLESESQSQPQSQSEFESGSEDELALEPKPQQQSQTESVSPSESEFELGPEESEGSAYVDEGDSGQGSSQGSSLE